MTDTYSWAGELDSDREPRTITIGWTLSDRGAGYVSFVDGYRPGARQHVVCITVDLPARLEPHRIAELVFIATNAGHLLSGLEQVILEAIQATGYRGEEGGHWSISVGDTVTVDDVTLACENVGWEPVEKEQTK